jgi:hypothetical protein
MATIAKKEILEALKQLGEAAEAQGDKVELVLIGGALMVLLFEGRDSTRDVDVAIVAPSDPSKLRKLSTAIGMERGWPENWLNDAAKGYLIGLSDGPTIFAAKGIKVRRPSFAQLLAMKLSAWRDELDIADARRLLEELMGSREEVWNAVAPYVVPGNELKAQYAFGDLWEIVHGKD